MRCAHGASDYRDLYVKLYAAAPIDAMTYNNEHITQSVSGGLR